MTPVTIACLREFSVRDGTTEWIRRRGPRKMHIFRRKLVFGLGVAYTWKILHVQY